MGQRIIVSRLCLTKISPKVSCPCKVYSRLYNNRCDKSSRIGRTRATGISLYSSDSPAKCWQCDYPFKSEFFCQKCKALQEPPEKLNYFQIIGVEETYDVDVKELHRKYRDLQNILHPDRFGNSTDKEKRISASMSSLINKAYRTLSHPLDRGLYILRLKNVSIPEGTTTDLDPEFLMEIMERNEKVEEAAEDGEKLVKLMDENNAISDKLSKIVSDALKINNIEEAKSTLIRMKYYSSLQTNMKKLKRELGIVD